ncbi:MAG: hypothetical protein AAF689_16535 [Pseudomonadota bacterium]
MQIFKNSFGIIAICGLMSACASPSPDVVLIAPQPVFEKGGGGSCPPGFIYVPGAVPELAECIPEDECEELLTADGSAIPCGPVPGRAGDGGGSDSSGGSATGTPGRT